MTAPAILHLVCGSTGAGKTTHAHGLAIGGKCGKSTFRNSR